MPADTQDTAETIRLGYHGSPHLARRVLEALGYDAADVTFVHYDVRQPFRELRRGETDLMMVKYLPEEPDIVCGPPVLYDTRAVFVGSHHPLADRESVSVEEIADYDAFDCPGDFPKEIWDEIVPRETPTGRPIRRVHPMTTIEALTEILSNSNALHVSFQSMEPALPPGIRVVPVHDLPTASVSMAWLRSAELSPRAAALVKAMTDGL